MQQNQTGRRFSQESEQQPIYRFPQNQPAQGWQPQQNFPPSSQPLESADLNPKDRRALRRAHKKHRRIFTLWNLFAVIGIVTVIIQAARYVVIPLLIYLNILSGGAV